MLTRGLKSMRCDVTAAAQNRYEIEYELATRMRALRLLVEGEERGASLRFADRLGVGYQHWKNLENGLGVSLAVATKLLDLAPGLTLDWIYLGEESGLSVALSQELRLLVADVETL